MKINSFDDELISRALANVNKSDEWVAEMVEKRGTAKVMSGVYRVPLSYEEEREWVRKFGVKWRKPSPGGERTSPTTEVPPG